MSSATTTDRTLAWKRTLRSRQYSDHIPALFVWRSRAIGNRVPSAPISHANADYAPQSPDDAQQHPPRHEPRHAHAQACYFGTIAATAQHPSRADPSTSAATVSLRRSLESAPAKLDSRLWCRHVVQQHPQDSREILRWSTRFMTTVMIFSVRLGSGAPSSGGCIRHDTARPGQAQTGRSTDGNR
jgi:hypothetical protein